MPAKNPRIPRKKGQPAKSKKAKRTPAHKIQAAIAMEQRAKAAGKTSAAAVYRRFINANKKSSRKS
jgi:hypothetical protein